MKKPRTGLKRAYYRLRNWIKPDSDFFLKRVTGVLHVGAHLGEERELYAEHRLNVLWIEPMNKYFEELTKAIAQFPKQKALCELITDVDGQSYPFHISSNDGASSSILELGDHKEIWPEVDFTEIITLQSITLSSLVKREQVDLAQYNALVMDTQGSELLVLKGATDLLDRFKYIKTEAADFESYKGCCRLDDIDKFLGNNNFKRIRIKRFAHKTGIGSFYDVLYTQA